MASYRWEYCWLGGPKGECHARSEPGPRAPRLSHAGIHVGTREFKQNVWVAPFLDVGHEAGVRDLIDLLGIERVLFGSDWPHPEGIPEPRAYPDYLPEHVSAGALRRMMRDNARELNERRA